MPVYKQDEKRFHFIHIPRTAGRFVESVIEDNNFKYFAFIAQDIYDAGFTEEEAETIIVSLLTKKVILISIGTPASFEKLNKEDYDSWVQDCFSKTATINGKWMFYLTEAFINDKAKGE